MSIYADEGNWRAMEQRRSRAKAAFDLQSLIGPVKGIEDWPAGRLHDSLKRAMHFKATPTETPSGR